MNNTIQTKQFELGSNYAKYTHVGRASRDLVVCMLTSWQVRGQDMVHVQPYTVQCVLPINLYTEFIYVFLWYWILLVSAASLFR